ncbi:MAG: hypothetical protein JW844_03705 [Candidatus Omnitrophica bacterium]|nr:hypothetical protein [Candidatus Omnitrophota bacterium]
MSLYSDVALSGHFKVEEQGVLMKVLVAGRGIPSGPAKLTVTCTFTDGLSGEDIATLTDTKEFTSQYSNEPLETQQDLDALSELFGVWGRRLAHFILQQKAPPEQ